MYWFVIFLYEVSERSFSAFKKVDLRQKGFHVFYSELLECEGTFRSFFLPITLRLGLTQSEAFFFFFFKSSQFPAWENECSPVLFLRREL